MIPAGVPEDRKRLIQMHMQLGRKILRACLAEEEELLDEVLEKKPGAIVVRAAELLAELGLLDDWYTTPKGARYLKEHEKNELRKNESFAAARGGTRRGHPLAPWTLEEIAEES